MNVRARRWSILAGGLLALSMIGAPALAAAPSADDPVATVNGLLDTVAAKDFATLPTFVCDQYAQQVADTFDFTSAFAGLPEGIDIQGLVDGLILTVDPRSATLVSNDGAAAVVDLQATLHVTIDEAAAREFVTQLLASQGLEVSDAMIDAVLPALLSEFGGQAQDLTESVDLVYENGVWLVCEAFGEESSPVPSSSPAASPPASPAA